MSYKDLKSYQQAVIIYDFTVDFCRRYVDGSNMSHRSYRTADQMEQAARSGKQNIVEGSSGRSQKSALHLLGVARASFQELLEDYEDFLRQRGFRQWGKNDKEAITVRQLVYQTDKSYRTYTSNKAHTPYETYKSYLNNSEIAANVVICLIHQVNFLLDRQTKAAEQQFIKEGDYQEKLSGQRNEERKKVVSK
jgi:restriction system protein